ncbi:RNA-splicing ligase RtcB [Sorangium cellulosum]|uniref:tRNA-splicing ligase RtcB n=1 Tax=Sorangium cellulosum TaxID=56 RepID=A0A150U2C8_SORCE|nr:RNA-splicing ligase RtcB [Sorangium cellulosum]KYG11120.1 RNA-splicing ligase RtcB [Sorangium cellulosum]
MAYPQPSSSTSEVPVRGIPLTRLGPFEYEIPTSYRRDMRVPARVFADPEQLAAIQRDRSLEQLVNVATLPGIVGAALGMPDMHEGYGFPVGGVAATLLPDGVISPGGIGFDINCGVRLLVSRIDRATIAPHLEAVVHELSRSVPTGAGRGGPLLLSDDELDRLLNEGVPWLLQARGLGRPEDLDVIESGGCLPGADAAHVSSRAKQRGRGQLGSLGSGNHFLEVQVVEEIFDEAAAERLGLASDRVAVLIHTGSRGLGHQVCTDHVRLMDEAAGRLGIELPDRQLACAPLSSPEGRRYLAAMCAAANFGFANRQVIAETARRVFARVVGDGELALVYDVAHNTAKIERAAGREVCVHRKGATRAFGPSSAEIPARYRGLGQPVFIPGSMGTASFVLVGTDASAAVSFSSTCHGAGRTMSRGAAKRQVTGHELRQELERRGIVVRCPSNAELAEEAPAAYKDVERVVDVVHGAGIARKVARLRPMGVVKG